jgi:hypothetical protein
VNTCGVTDTFTVASRCTISPAELAGIGNGS